MKREIFKIEIEKLLINTIIFFGCVVYLGCSGSSDNPPETQCGPQDCTTECTDGCPAESNPSYNKVASILHGAPPGDYIMVMAHRGGFVNTPENSMSAIENSTNLGVDIVEMDVRLSKDGHLVIMHDNTIDRTTNGSGLVSDYTLAELKQFKLLMPNGAVSDEFIPSLREVLAYSKGKMHLFIDKGHDYLDFIYEDMAATNTVEQTIMGGTWNISQLKFKFPDVWYKINYIPRVGTGQSLTYITDLDNEVKPLGYFPSCGLISSNNDVYQKIKEYNKWMFSETLHGGSSDNCSEIVLGNSIWDWELQNGIDGIFTDKSKELIEYLKARGLHDNE